jgi:predicted MFS family arabinose efflux permease
VSSIGLIVEHNSRQTDLSKNEGLIYTASNLAWTIGPLLVGIVLREIGTKYVFIFASLIILISLAVFKSSKVDCKIVKKNLDKKPVKNFLDFFKDKDRVKAYFLGSGVNFWWSLIFIYFPLLIIKYLHEDYIGYLLFAVLVPLLLTQYFFGKIAGKTGFRKMFFIGFMLPAVIALLCFFFFNFWFIVPALIIASLGIAMTESTTEAYFFDICKGKEDQHFYSPYNTAIDFGQFIGELLPAILLFFLPFKFIFLVYAGGLFILSLISLTMKDVIECKKKNHLRR